MASGCCYVTACPSSEFQKLLRSLMPENILNRSPLDFVSVRIERNYFHRSRVFSAFFFGSLEEMVNEPANFRYAYNSVLSVDNWFGVIQTECEHADVEVE